MTDHELADMRLALDALATGRDAAAAVAADYHESMRDHFPERHAAVDADVAQIEAAIAALRAALPPERKPVLNPMCAWPFPEKKL